MTNQQKFIDAFGQEAFNTLMSNCDNIDILKWFMKEYNTPISIPVSVIVNENDMPATEQPKKRGGGKPGRKTYNPVWYEETVSESCSMLDRAKKVIKEHIESAMCGIFDTRNCVGDEMVTIYDKDGLTVDICYYWEYFEVFGLSMSEFQLLEDFYETLRKEVRAKEKETTEMNDYTVMAEHGVSCIIWHQKQEETEICVKIIKHNGSGRYEVIYNNYGYEPFSYNKFYVGIPCLGEVRDDIRHFYSAGHININDIMVLLDEACCVSRRNNMTKQLMNSRYGLASADIRDCFGDSAFDKIYNNIDVSREMQFAYFGKWPGIECKTTARDKYRGRDKLPEISEVIFNKPATIVKWADGTKTVVKVQGREKYDKEKGLAMAIAKKAMGNSNYYYTIMKRYLEDEK